ncbi:hypothetical protein ABT57_24910, partial [Photobacterium ganghwense]
NDEVCITLVEAMSKVAPSLPLVVMAVPNHEKYRALAADYGIQLWFETFVSRDYYQDGRLVPRNVPGSSNHEPTQIRSQARQMIGERSVTTLDGQVIPLHADT